MVPLLFLLQIKTIKAKWVVVPRSVENSFPESVYIAVVPQNITLCSSKTLKNLRWLWHLLSFFFK